MAEGGAGKKGMEPDEFKTGVTRKMRDLLGDQYKSHEDNITKIVENMKKVIVKRDRTTGDGTKVDKRRASADHYQSAGTLPAELDKHDSPKKVKEDTSGKQGVERFDKTLNKSYHEEQYELFIRPEISKRIRPYTVDEDGWLCSDGKRINTETFCQVIDKLSKGFFPDFLGQQERRHMPDDQDRKVAEELADVQERCRDILMGRFQGDMTVENDLNNQGQRQVWQQHVDTIFSFAALLVVLALYRGKVTGNPDVNPTGSF